MHICSIYSYVYINKLVHEYTYVCTYVVYKQVPAEVIKTRIMTGADPGPVVFFF